MQNEYVGQFNDLLPKLLHIYLYLERGRERYRKKKSKGRCTY